MGVLKWALRSGTFDGNGVVLDEIGTCWLTFMTLDDSAYILLI